MLVESHNTYFHGDASDWGRMIIILDKANTPDGIWNLFDTHQNNSPDQNINWEECAVELARSRSSSIDTFKMLLRLSIANHLNVLGVEKWQGKVENFINESPARKKYKRRTGQVAVF